ARRRSVPRWWPRCCGFPTDERLPLRAAFQSAIRTAPPPGGRRRERELPRLRHSSRRLRFRQGKGAENLVASSRPRQRAPQDRDPIHPKGSLWAPRESREEIPSGERESLLESSQGEMRVKAPPLGGQAGAHHSPFHPGGQSREILRFLEPEVEDPWFPLGRE